MKPISGKRNVFILIVFMIGVIAFHDVSAQDVTNSSVTATVQTALTVVSTQDLQFGTVFQGVAKTVSNDDAAVTGIFTITGAPSAGISIHNTASIYRNCLR